MIQDFPVRRRGRTFFVILLAVVIAILLSLSGIVRFLTDIAWFKAVGYDEVFWTTFRARLILWLVSFGVALAVALINNFAGLGSATRLSDLEHESRRQIFWIGIAFSVVAPIIFAFLFQGDYWEEYLKALHSKPLGIKDPIFGFDIGYYLFKRPFYMGLVSSLLSYIGIITVFMAGIYFLTGMLPGNRVARVHLGVLVAVLLGLAAILHKFRVEGIVYSTRGRVFGAGYTDVHVTLPYYRILIGILVASAILTLIFTMRKRFSPLVFSGVGLYILTVVIGGIAGAVVQNYVVSPNEIAKESPYIRYNIDYTRMAFGLDKIKTYSFPDNDTLSREMIERNPSTINNIRINDYQAALETYNQLQGIRRYYAFRGIDVDRYNIDGRLTEVFISARELNKDQINNSHVNMMYKFTHGMGVSLNAVNKVTPQGQPDFLIQDIPPKSKVDLKITQPRIYYGELTNDAVVVNGSIKEFDYPAGDTNVENLYDGKGGVSLSGINRFLFSMRQASLKMLVSGYIENDSRIMVYRNIHRRVRQIAPFLYYDNDPYIVIADGRLKWIVDAYTISDRYPYSEPVEYRGRIINYIRNPVKVVIDAYDGTVDYYTVDPKEPFVQVYSSIYPGLFKNIDDMPDSLKAHIRYPEDLFDIQTRQYRKYHMSDITVFYNEEDLWQIPTEKYAGDVRDVKPYYVLMKLPENGREEFILMRPFTPVNKANAIAWMAARNDGEHYGELLIYKFPKQKLVYGPMQVENRIDQNPIISRELSLWNQRGSRVIRGNLLMIPIEDTLLYIEPLYIQSEAGSALPEVKRIIAAYKDRVVMEETLELALERLVTAEARQEQRPEREAVTSEELIRRAADYLERIRTYSGEGDWVEFGKSLKELEDTIRALEEQIEE